MYVLRYVQCQVMRRMVEGRYGSLILNLENKWNAMTSYLSSRFSPRERVRCNHSIRDWLAFKTNLDTTGTTITCDPAGN